MVAEGNLTTLQLLEGLFRQAMNETPLQRRSGEASDFESSTDLKLSREQVLAKRIAERAREAWPVLSIDEQPFVERVISLLDATLPVEEALRHLAIEDLFLAYACSLNDKKALTEFAKECDGELRIVARKLHITNDEFDDVRQELWDKLFLPSGDRPPKILEYCGRGQLRHWFRVLATRSILYDLRKSRRLENRQFTQGDPLLGEAALDTDPELASIRAHYRDAFRSAFEKAVQILEPEERNLLKCHYILGMSTDQLAKAFGNHKATAARHLAKAREKLLEHTRTQLKDQLDATSVELDSVMRLFEGELSISLSRLLK